MKLLYAIACLAILSIGAFVVGNINQGESGAEARELNLASHQPVDRSTVSVAEVIDSSSYDFGVVDPGREYSHVFAIRNTGQEILELSKGKRSCDCASIEILDREIKPGDVGRVKLNWEARYSTDEFHEGFSVNTNIADQPPITLSAHGKIKISVRAAPGSFDSGLIPKGETISGITQIYSQRWEQLVLQQVTSSAGEIEYETSPVSDQVLGNLEALAGFELHFRTPQLETPGRFNHYVRLHVSPTKDTPETDWITLDLSLSGSVFGKYVLDCDLFDFQNQIDFKSRRADQEHHCSILLKLANAEDPLPEPKFTSYPAGLKFKWTALNKERGIYKGDILIPAGLPEGDYQQENDLGWVNLEFDHPEVKSIRIPMVLRLFVPTRLLQN